MGEKIKVLIIGIIVFVIGLYVSQIGTFSNGDAYITSISMTQNSILFLASIVSIIGYLIIKELKVSNKLSENQRKDNE